MWSYVFLVWVSTSSIADERQKIEISPFTPIQIKKNIGLYGESKVFKFIIRDNAKLDKLLKGIESGEKDWLDLYIPFKNVSDGVWGETLAFSLSYALSHNAPKTLMIIKELEGVVRPGGFSGLHAESICGHLEENWADRTEPDKVLASNAFKEINNRINSIKKVHESQLDNVKKSYNQKWCLNS